MRRHIDLSAAFALLGFMVVGMPTLAAADQAAELQDPLTNARFYTDAVGNQGIFPGKVLCLCCDFQSGDAAKKPCKEDAHHYALKIEGDSTIHPLVPGDKLAHQQLKAAELHGKQVSVSGTMFPSTGVIVVGGITATK